MSRQFVVVTTRLPPAVCGIGTYSALLRNHWPGEERAVQFLVVGEADRATSQMPHDTIAEFAGDGRKLLAALRRIGTADLLLHYAGRAYHRFGCPTSLPAALATWKREFPDSRMMVFVHEMPGSMAVTSRHFWLGLVNTRVIRQLAKIADAVATNTQSHAARLSQISGRNDVILVPVSANIEPATNARTESRARGEFVIFGLPFGRLQTLQAFGSCVESWSREGRLTQLHVIGPQDDRFAADADALIASWQNSAVVVRHGALRANEVSRLLSRAEFALTNVTDDTWSKSSAFMACAAHRCAIVRSGGRAEAMPFSGTFTRDEVANVSPAEIDRRTDQLAAWYNDVAAWPTVAARLAAGFEEVEQRA